MPIASDEPSTDDFIVNSFFSKSAKRQVLCGVRCLSMCKKDSNSLDAAEEARLREPADALVVRLKVIDGARSARKGAKDSSCPCLGTTSPWMKA
jgi:hypothetical protein